MTAPPPLNKRTTRVGCVYRPQFGPERLAATARAADVAGLDELWLWEDCFLTGGISAAAIALSHSSNLTVGIGVLPAPMRNVAVTAMEVSTLARAFPGRLRVGVGHGLQTWMAQIGAKVASPMTLLREYLTCLSRLLRAEEVSYRGRYVTLDAVQLDGPPLCHVDLLSGAMGPKSLQLSGELASGTVLTGDTTATKLPSVIEHIRQGKALSGDGSRAHAIVVYVLCTIGPDAAAQLAREIDVWGYDPNSRVGVHGGAVEIADGLRPWIDAGADTVVAQPTSTTDIVEFVEFIGGGVKPILG